MGLLSLLRHWTQARRFNKLSIKEKSIVFYAEDKGSRPHFMPIIETLTREMNQQVCYLTSDEQDPVLQTDNDRILSFCIGAGTICTYLFMTMQARVLVMTLPDLETFYLKRSKNFPVHYAYIHHSIVSSHMIYRPGSFDHFDSIFCVGPHHVKETREYEKLHNLKAKELFEHGYGRLDAILADKDQKKQPSQSNIKEVLIAPSWGPQGLFETCGSKLVQILLDAGYKVVARPHPMTGRKWPQVLENLQKEFGGKQNFTLETNMADKASLHRSHIMISDWSGAALEYALGLERPVLFVDVEKKINNPQYRELSCPPIEISIRDQIGQILSPDLLEQAPKKIEQLCQSPEKFENNIKKIRAQLIYNLGNSGKIAARHLVELAQRKENLNGAR